MTMMQSCFTLKVNLFVDVEQTLIFQLIFHKPIVVTN